MFYYMITNARNQWLTSSECTVKDLLAHIENAGQMRDAQIDAIKTYLFLKIGCDCRPLSHLFQEGRFNTLDLQTVELSAATRTYLQKHPESAALLEYARLKNDLGEQLSRKLEEQVCKAPESIDYQRFFQDAFYGVSYTDYLFSLPMGAGKTYLMAAFIYLDLYFAMNEPQNPAFAHNFIIFAPSGLKSSVVPSLKTIQKFDPAWVIPEPIASSIKRALAFEVLDQGKTASKSNKTKNPNVQKIANHQPLSALFGLVAVTNAEKVILDRIKEKNRQISINEKIDDERDRQANELRNLIGKLPALAVFIDEVHHAISDEIKLRAMVSRWAERGTVNSIIGFSGTPYLDKTEKITVTDKLTVSTAEITNTVYYYPLVKGVGNFLKRPVVKIADIADSHQIVENGVREFLDTYRDTLYQDGTTAKLGIYCGTIEKLEDLVYPLVSRIAGEYGLSSDCILKFHKGNGQYPQSADSQMLFDTLDSPISKIRIVLLVQVGKEGWDCRSLTGIILSQKGDCPQKMVLQTSCRCLRQVDKGRPEIALIYLNSTNGGKLIAQLRQRHHISLDEFITGARENVELNRYDCIDYLKLPMVDFYQLKVSYETIPAQDNTSENRIADAAVERKIDIIRTTDFSLADRGSTVDDGERGTEPAVFSHWLYGLTKSSIGTLSMEQLNEYRNELRSVFDTITYECGEGRYFSSKYDRPATEANIRKAFCQKHDYKSIMKRIPKQASLLNIASFESVIHTQNTADYLPDQDIEDRNVLDDKGILRTKPEIQAAIAALEASESTANRTVAKQLWTENSSHPQNDCSYHYLPRHTKSGYEQAFLRDILPLSEVKQFGLEVYHNDDRTMTGFKIKCYKSAGCSWNYIGVYTPNFLIIQRKNGKIHKALIVETKGNAYTNDPTFKYKRFFVESEFLRQNNSAFGYKRFEYLYLEDTMPENERIMRIQNKIREFFMEFS